MHDIGARCYCKPGIRNKSRSRGVNLSYRLLGEGTYGENDNPFSAPPFSTFHSLQQLQFKIKTPIINKDNLKLLAGYKYEMEHFNFKQIGIDFSDVFEGLANDKLKSNSLSLLLSRPFTETKYFALRFRYSSNGDYKQFMSFKNKYSIYKLLGFYAIKPNEDLEWGFGLNISKSFRRTNFLPFFVYNKNFNQRWGIESVFPGFVFGRYNINPRNIFLFGAEYNSQSYRIDFDNSNEDPLAFDYNHSELVTSIKLEHRFFPWFWGSIKTGYQIHFSNEFESKNDFSESFRAEPSDAFFFRIGLFVSPHSEEEQ